MMYIFRHSAKSDRDTKVLVEKVIDSCKVCQENKKTQSKPKVAFNKSTNFNDVVTLDLKDMGDKYILWMICSFSRFIRGVVIGSKTADEVINALHHGWCLPFGFPSQGFWSDNSEEFQNEKMKEFLSRMGFSVKYGPPQNP